MKKISKAELLGAFLGCKVLNATFSGVKTSKVVTIGSNYVSRINKGK